MMPPTLPTAATAVTPLDDLRAGNDSRLDVLESNGFNWM
jgi:hypothetical protein